MVKQAASSNECGLCVVAMLIDCEKQDILAQVGGPEKPDYFWLNYMRSLGFVLEDVRDDPQFDRSLAWSGMFNGYLSLSPGSRYYCSVYCGNRVHAVAVDETGMVFDPRTSAPIVASCTLKEYLCFNQEKRGGVAIASCYRIGKPTIIGD